MSDSSTGERRKNPSRKREMAFDVVYQVHWNPTRHTFDVYRDGENTGAFARDKAGAVGVAVREAQQEDGSPKISVSSFQNGRLTVEWCR
jgi:hypothetical protein